MATLSDAAPGDVDEAVATILFSAFTCAAQYKAHDMVSAGTQKVAVQLEHFSAFLKSCCLNDVKLHRRQMMPLPWCSAAGSDNVNRPVF
jgi:hypothetical protein